MRIIRVHLVRFRGYAEMVILPGLHAAVVGEPRAGRTDLITALRRVLDPRSTAGRPNLFDVHRPRQPSSDEEPEPLTEVEITLVDLDPAVEQDLDDRLEAINPVTGLPADEANSESAVIGLRLCYRLRYDEVTDTAEHWVEYPATGTRVPRADRELVAAVVIDRAAPLQLRTDGAFRRLVAGLDEAGLRIALGNLSADVAAATEKLAGSSGVRQTVADVLAGGAAQLLEMTGTPPEDDVGFVAEDGSLAAILRAIQPTLTLDGAGALPLASHGSTTTAVLAAAEAALTAGTPSAIVLADDFGDDLDTASAEYLAARLRRDSGQVWLSTRRPEVLRAFQPEEVIRLTRSHGQRSRHQLAPTTDRKARGARRQLHLLLLPAMTARAVALLEGPHDLEGYTAVADRRLRGSGTAPPAAYGVRMVAAGLGDGGKDQLPKLAKLAADLGFHVRVVLDHDKPGTDAALIRELTAIAEQVIRLPERTSVERALVHDVPPANLRTALQRINSEYGLGINVDGINDGDLEATIIKMLKQKGGLHRPFVDALPPKAAAPLAKAVLDTLAKPPGATILVEVPEP